MQQIPRNMPKAPDFDNVQDMVEWYRKAYRIPRFKNKVKRIARGAASEAKEYANIFHPREVKAAVKVAIDDFRYLLGLEKTKVPARIMKEGTSSPKLRNYLLDQLDKSFDEALKTPAVRRSPQILIPALSKATGIFGMLVPSSLDQENTMELPFPQRPFPVEDAQIRQQRMNQLTPRAGYYKGGIVKPATVKPKVKRKKAYGGKTMKKYAKGGGIRKAQTYG